MTRKRYVARDQRIRGEYEELYRHLCPTFPSYVLVRQARKQAITALVEEHGLSATRIRKILAESDA